MIILRLLTLLFFLILTTQAAWAVELANKITGVEKAELKNVVARLKIQQQGVELTQEKLEQLYEAAPEQIKQALQPYGYFEAKITSQLKQLDSKHWQASYHIDLGPQLKIHEIDFQIEGSGKSAAEFKAVLSKTKLQVGEPLLIADYNETRKQLFSVAEQLGYLDAQLTTHTIKINLESYTATVILHFNTDERYYFGKVNFQKNPLSDKFLQRYVNFKPGQPYSTADVQILQKRLNTSNFYAQALVKPNRQNAKNYQVPIDVALTPLKSQQYSLGLGYGTDTGPRTSIGWDWRYLTATGHRLSSILRLSPIQNTVQSVYVIPGNNPLTEHYTISASVMTNQLPRGDNIVSKVSAASISKVKGWQQTIALNYQFEHYRFITDPQEPYRNSLLLLPSISWQRTHSDNMLYPRQGYRLQTTLQGASKKLLADSNLFQASINGKYIQAVGKQGRVLLRADLGYTSIHAEQTNLPLSLSYFAGGARSVRGYSYQALGPGRYLLVGSVEYQHEIIKNWNVAVFFDVGNAFLKLPANNHLFNALQQGVGIGAVWISPVGPLNLSVAKAINWPGQPMRIQFSMGTDL